jgi:hypothetical protein
MITQRKLGENPLIENQIEAYESVDKQKRRMQIIEILEDAEEPMSAKEIAVEMYKRGYTPTSERNFASPRITELLRTGVLDCLGKKKCEYSGKSVSVFGLLNENI